MAFEVYRMEKLPTESKVIYSLKHDLDLSYINENGEEIFYRKTRDEEKSKLNKYQWQNKTKEERLKTALALFRKKLPKKKRSNAVLGATAIFSYSHDAKISPDEYFEQCFEFAKKNFGLDNIFCWSAHFDETTPHMTVHFVPKDENGNLNARKIFGNKKTLSEWQDKFHNEVGEKFGLERGIKNTFVSHQTLKKFYAKIKNLEQDLENFEIPKKNLTESWDDYLSRTKEILKDYVKPILKPLTDLQNQLKKLEKREKDLQKEIDDKVKEQTEEERLSYQKNNSKLLEEKNDLYKKNKELKEEIETLKTTLKDKEKIISNWLNKTPAELRRIATDREVNELTKGRRK